MASFTSEVSLVLLLLLTAATFNQRSLCSSISIVRCNEKDRWGLLIFKRNIIDPANQLYSWSNEEDCCLWKGVQCDVITGRVTELSLSWESLQGEVNLSLLELEFLNYLDLSFNEFEAISFPSIHSSAAHSQRYSNQSLDTTLHSYSNLSSLLYLDLSYNSDNLIMDDLGWLSRVPSLKYLNLSGISLHNEANWLQSLSMLPSLSELRLKDCHLTNLNASLKYVNFTSLVTLDISYNHFNSCFPDWLFSHSSEVSYIDLSYNNLQGEIPMSLLNLRNLKFLNLCGNKLNGSIPDWLGQHENLQHLDLFQNLFSGIIPSSLGNLSSLIYLDISFNSLSGNLPKSLGQLSDLESLQVGGNSLEGVLSEANFAKFHNLKQLDLGDSRFVFHFDPNWIPPFNLSDINLRSSNLGPTFPSWLYTQRALEHLDISSSGISTIDESEFWNFVAGIKVLLNMSQNSISADISKVKLNTQYMILASNNFKGGLPHLSANVRLLDLAYNSFAGSIFPLLCDSANTDNNLRNLDISNNLLTGELSDCWANWKYLSHIYLGSNKLTGKLPPSFGSLPDLLSIDLHNNSLFGLIPVSLKKCTNLVLLNLERNNFSGSIPTWMNEHIGALQLRSNQFTGKIPAQLCQLSYLNVLDLADNKLSGPIPRCLYNIGAMVEAHADLGMMTQCLNIEYPYRIMVFIKGRELEYVKGLQFLRTVDLSINNLSGEVPPELFRLVALKSLNLSQNHLMGKLPNEIGVMRNLESLDLSNNHFIGEIPLSISNLSFLSFLNLSYNDFYGQIPLSTQLQSFDAWSYIGNPQLCGVPLTKNCTKDEKPIAEEHDASSETESSFYLGMGAGFAVGFWGVCVVIFLNRPFRHAYFRFLGRIADRIRW